MTDFISVIMAAYNAELYIEESIQSILEQISVNFELIVVNDGSVDQTESIIKKIAKNDDRVILINQINQGLPKSLNNALRIAKGDYIARMDADDIALPDRLYTQLQFLKKNDDINIVGSYLIAFGDGKKRIWKFPICKYECDAMMLFRNPLAHPAIMLRRCVFEMSGVYDDKFAYDQDYELWARASSDHGIANIPKVLLKYRIHESQMGALYTKNNRIESQQKTQLFLLRKLDLFPTKEQLDIHTLISNAYRLEFDAKVDTDCLQYAGQWIIEIFKKNSKLKRYNQVALRNSLLQNFYSLCLYSSNNGILAYQIYQRYQRDLGIKRVNLLLLISGIFRMGRKSHLLIYNQIKKVKLFLQ